MIWAGATPTTAHSGVTRLRLEEIIPSFESSRARNDYSEAHVYAGQAAGVIADVPPAGQIVRRLIEEAETYLRGASKLAM